MSRMSYDEDERREELSEEEQEWAKELADLIYNVSQAYAYANMVEHTPQAYLAEVPKDSKSVVYAKAIELLAYRSEMETKMTSEWVH